MDKCIITIIDTENIVVDSVTTLITYVEYRYKEYKNIGYFCFGMDDGKSSVSEQWKKAIFKGFYWISVKGEREKNKVDKAIIDKINELLNIPKFSAIDVWVIASSDGDYVPAIKAIKEKGHKAVVVGSATTSAKLREACDEFYSIFN